MIGAAISALAISGGAPMPMPLPDGSDAVRSAELSGGARRIAPNPRLRAISHDRPCPAPRVARDGTPRR